MITAFVFCMALHAQAPLAQGQSYRMPNDGRFDYMAVDDRYRRVYASHPDADSLAVLDLKSGSASEIDTGWAVNGVQIDLAQDKLFLAGSGRKLIQLNLKTLKVENQIPLEGPGDDLAIDTKRQEIYVCHDEGQHVWVFDSKSLMKVDSVTVPEAPEYVEYDPATDRLYQNIKSNNTVQVIDAASKKVVKEWSTAPQEKPHGLAIDSKTGRVFSAGSNGKLSVFDMKAGTLLTTLEIVPLVDQIAFDSGLKRIYCAGAGAITVIQETADGATVLGNVPSPTGAHTVAVDPRTHDVWISYANTSGAYFMKYTVR